jgi:hypothetical protein
LLLLAAEQGVGDDQTGDEGSGAFHVLLLAATVGAETDKKVVKKGSDVNPFAYLHPSLIRELD